MAADVPQETLRKASRSGVAGGEGSAEVVSSYYKHLTGSWYDAKRYVEEVGWEGMQQQDGKAAVRRPWELLKR